MFKKILNQQVFKYVPEKSNIFWYWQGRVALYAILESMGLKQGDEVIVPAYTCVVVSNAIIYLGAKPIYVDIDPKTYNMDSNKIEKEITPKTKVIICQNTYGLSSNIEFILKLAKKYNLYTVEDCTHGFGGTYDKKPNGSYCDAAFYSTQWNKPFSTGIGGFALINNEELLDSMKNLESKKHNSSLKDKIMLKLLYFIRNNIITDKTYWSLIKAYRWLSKNNIVLGSSKGEEITSVVMPDNYFKDFTEIQVKEGIKNIKKLDELLILRKNNAKIYTDFLSSKGKICVEKSLFNNHSFLKYPILVKDRRKFLKLAEKSKIPLGDWFLSPLHPVKTKNWTPWFFDPKKFPIAMNISSKVVNIPTDTFKTDKVISFLSKNIEEVL